MNEFSAETLLTRSFSAPPTKALKPAMNKHYLALGLVMLCHVGVIALLALNNTVEKTPPKLSAPMMVSLIAPPTPKPELVPIIEPPKPVVKQKPKPKLVVEKIRPIETPTERLVEATTEPPKVQEKPAEVAPTAVSAPVVEEPKVAAKPEPVPEKPITEKIEPPRFGVSYLNNPAPDYPPLSRRLNEEGRVLMRVLVSAQGNAEEVRVTKSSGSERLDDAAVDAVKRWRFVPATKNNQPLSAYVLVPIKFSLAE